MDMCYLACVYRTSSGYCGSTGGAATCPHRQKKRTNADRIRSMTDEELSAFLGSIVHDYEQGTAEIEGVGYVSDDWLAWLREEAGV